MPTITSNNTNISQIKIDSKEILESQMLSNVLLKPHLSSKTDNEVIKRMSSKLNRVSLSIARCSRPDQMQSIGLTPSKRSSGNMNESFSFARSIGTSRSSNQFLQSYTATKQNHGQTYDYPIQRRNGEKLAIPGMKPNLKYHKSTISLSTTSSPSSSLLKKCLSVAKLKESLESTNKSKSISNLKNAKRVSFTNLHIREYEVKLGDHPECRSGPPITMGWNYTKKKSISFDLLDENSCLKVNQPVKIIDAKSRCQMLLSAGYTKSEIIQSVQNKNQKHVLKTSKFDNSLRSSSIFLNAVHGTKHLKHQFKSDSTLHLRQSKIRARVA